MTELLEALPIGYRSFTPTLEDVPRATEFFNLVEVSEWSIPDFSIDEVREEWEELDLPKSVVLVESMTGEVVASMTVQDSDGIGWEVFGYVHPDHQGRGLGTWITNWSESISASRLDETREGYRISLLNLISTVNAPARDLMRLLDYQPVKVFRRMRIELEERPATVDWPEGIELIPFVEGRDELRYFDAFETAFADHWSFAPRSLERWERSWKTGDYDTTLWLQVLDADQVVGICIGKPAGDGGWISNVGVLPAYRRRGLARKLLQESFGRFWDKGIRNVDLGVDSENRQSAIDLYLGTGMRQTQSYEANQKILRDGLNWRADED